MQELAATIREQLDTLVDRYDARLSAMPGYSNLPETMRRDLERRFLNLIIQSLEAGDYTALVQYAQQRADQWAARGLNLVWFQQALSIPEDLVVPLVQSVETSNFVWQALNRSQGVVWKMVAEQMRHTEERFRSIVETAHSGIMIIDDEFHFIYANEQLAQISGFSQEELIGADFRQLLDEDSQRLMADRYVRRQRGEDVPTDYDVTIVRKDGAQRHAAMSAVLLKDTAGRTQTVAQVLDVTEQAQAEAALERERNLLHTLIDALPDQIFFKDTQGRIMLNNMADARAMGVASPAEAIGKNVFDTFPLELAQRYNTDDMEVIQSGQALYNREELGRDESGQLKWIQTTKVPLTDAQGNKLGLVGFAHDITTRKQMEQRIRQSLEQREQQARTVTEVSQEVAAAPNLNELLQRVVTLIKERFNYYHAQIFRYDPGRDMMMLVTGYGEVGQHMLADGHQVSMGRGVVGLAAAQGQSILATDVAQTEDWRPNPHLPETKGELAVPIKLRDQVLGILDVQSDQAGALNDDDRLLVEGLCGQIATAMESTRLLEELRRGEAELSQALHIAKLAYWEYDVEKDLFLFNDQFYSIFHTTAEQQGGYQLSSAQYAERFVYPEDLPVVGAEIERALNSTDRHYSRDLIHRIQYLDGGIGHISVSINIERDEQGRILRYYGANQDVTERKQIEEALEQQQSLMRALMDTVTDHIYFKDLQSRFLRISKSQADRFGLSDPAQAVGKTDFDFFTEEHARPAYEDEQEIIRTGQPISREERETWLDRPDSWVLTTKFPLRDEAGRIVGTFGTSLDVTERKQAEAELARSAQLLNTILQAVPDLLYVKNTNSEFLLANQALADLVHVQSPDELIGKTDFDFFEPAMAQKFYQDEQMIVQSGQPLATIEEPSIGASGQEIWLSTTKVPFRNSRGEIEGIVGLGRDITERKQAEVLLAQERNLLQTVIDTLPDSIYAKDTESRFTLANLTEIRLSGATTFDELRGKNDFDRYPRELAEQYFANEQPILHDGVSVLNHEEPGLDDLGNPRWHLSTKVPLRNNQGKIIGLVGTTRDITESKRAEAERERLLLEQQKRSLQLQTASEVARAASSILKLDDLLPQAVDLIRDRFNFYYTGIFLTDEANQWAMLRAGTGPAGQQMLANGHRLAIGGNSMISNCIVQQQARIALDVGAEAIRFDNPLLPLTRSEMALPLISRGQIIGAMTIQSDQPAAFSAEDITVLQSMAGQISNAVENARLYEQTQEALGDTDRLLQASAELNLSQTYTDVLNVIRKFTVLGQRAQTIAINVFDRPWTDSQTPTWIELIGYYTQRSSRMDVGTRFPIAMFPSAKSLLRPDAPAVIENLDTAQLDPNTYALFAQRLASKSVIFIPLVVGGEWFGYINVLYPEPNQFDEADVRRLAALIRQAAVAVQNLRNLASAQLALTETDASYRATQAIGRAQTIQDILAATTHVVDLLGMTRASLRVVTQRDINHAATAVDIYACDRIDGQWVLQPTVKGAPVSDSDALKPLLHNPEAISIFADAQNPDSRMPDQVRQSLSADGLRGSVSTSVSLQNEVLGALSFSGPQALNEAAEQRLRLSIRTLSDQAAVALQNRLLFEQTRAALQEVDAINRRLTGEAWDTYLHHQAGREVIRMTDDEASAPAALSLLDEQLTTGATTIERDVEGAPEATVTTPILLRGQPIGALRMRTSLDSWNEDTEAVLTDIAGHIAQAVENARLIEQTQRTASRERAINEINARVRQTIDLDAILRTAVNELGQSLKAARVTARIHVADSGQSGASDRPQGNQYD